MDEQKTSLNTRTLVIIGAVVLAIIIAGFTWWFFSRGANSEGTISGGSGFSQAPDKGVGSGQPSTSGNTSIPVPSSPQELPSFVQLSDVPVAGIGVVDAGNTVRYVERERGYVYELSGLSKDSTKKISNTTIPRVQEALFGNGGATVILRYLDNRFGSAVKVIKTYIGRISGAEGGTPGTIGGEFLADGISEIAISPDQNTAAYVLPTENGSSIQVMDLIDRAPKEVVKSPLSEWIPYITNAKDVFLASKASADIPGYLYRIRAKQKGYERIIGGKLGLTALPNQSGTLELYSENIQGNPALSIKGVYGSSEGGNANDSIAVGLISIAQKCVWSKDTVHAYCASFSLPAGAKPFPDLWYQGRVSLQDSFWKIDTQSGDIQLLGDPQVSIDKSFDAIDLTLSSDESILYFMNRTNGLLWGLRLPTPVPPSSASGLPTPVYTPQEMRDIQGSAP